MRTLSPERLRAIYDRTGAKLDMMAFHEDAAKNEMIKHGKFEEVADVFEFACGTGRLAESLLSSHLPKESNYFAMDMSGKMIELTRNKLKRFGERVRVEQSSGALEWPVEDASFDRVIMTFVVELLSKKEVGEVLEEAHRVLRTDAMLCLTGLTQGVDFCSKLVSWVFNSLNRINPTLTAGCRPIVVKDLLGANWQICHYDVVVKWGMAQEVLIAQKLEEI